MNTTPKSARAVLQELVSDIDAVGGPEAIANDWPDLAETYKHAVKALNIEINQNECDDLCPGWAVFNGNEIQRCDNCQRFKSDEEAIAYVRALEAFDVSRHYMEQAKAPPDWANHILQFARLLHHIHSVGEISEDCETMCCPGYLSAKISNLIEAMDMDWDDIQSLFKRAERIVELWDTSSKGKS